VVNLKGEFRSKLRFFGEEVVSLDVKQMQPTILAKILLQAVGSNPFSNAIFNGEDVYKLLMRKNKELKERTAAKKFLFQLIFGKPMNEIGDMFDGDTIFCLATCKKELPETPGFFKSSGIYPLYPTTHGRTGH